jgi:hypothetical protein
VSSEVEWIVERERFQQLAPAWDALAQDEPDPFLCHAWFDGWWAAHPARDARVASVWRAGELVAGLPLMLGPQGAEGFGEPLLAPFRPLARDEQALAELARAIRRLPVATVTLHSALAGDPRTEALMRALRRTRPIVTRSHPDRFLSVETTGSWDDYRAAMKSRWGSVERKGRKLARDHDARAARRPRGAAQRGLRARGRGLEGPRRHRRRSRRRLRGLPAHGAGRLRAPR